MTEPERIISEHGLVGYRQLSVAMNSPHYLLSGKSHVWHPGVWQEFSSADCTAPKDSPHPTVEGNCSCGIYCFKEKESVREYLNAFTVATLTSVRVKLFLSGRIARHTLGYRAQRAKIAEIEVLWCEGHSDEETNDREYRALVLASELESTYKVPCSVVKYWDPSWNVSASYQPQLYSPRQSLSLEDYIAIASGAYSDANVALRRAARSRALQRLGMKKKALEKRVPWLKEILLKTEKELAAVTETWELVKNLNPEKEGMNNGA